jgi:hypothetical protein
MNSEQQHLLKELSKLGEVKYFNSLLERFAHHFANLDVDALGEFLDESLLYDGITKSQYLNLIENQLKRYKTEPITSLEYMSGKCRGCKKGCSGYIFADNLNKQYYALVLESIGAQITFLMECFNLDTSDAYKDYEQLCIKPTIPDGADNIPF